MYECSYCAQAGAFKGKVGGIIYFHKTLFHVEGQPLRLISFGSCKTRGTLFKEHVVTSAREIKCADILKDVRACCSEPVRTFGEWKISCPYRDSKSGPSSPYPNDYTEYVTAPTLSKAHAYTIRRIYDAAGVPQFTHAQIRRRHRVTFKY